MKKILSTILILSLLISVVPTILIPVSAADTTPNMSLVLNKTKVNVGETVSVTIAVENNPGICAITPVIVYDETAFEVVMDGSEPKVTYYGDWANPMVASAKASNGEVRFAYVTNNCENVSANGEVATFYFKAKETDNKVCEFKIVKPINEYDEAYEVAGNKKCKAISFTLGSATTTVGDFLKGLTYEIKNGKAIITGCNTSATGVITVPELIEDCPVTAIADGAFANASSIVCVTLPESVETLGTGVFENCTSLVVAKLPSNVTSIPADTYKGCTSLETMLIPETVTSIGQDAFSGCEKLVVKCKEGSAAATYCAQNDIPCEYYTHTVEIKGERVGVKFNNEGKVELPELYQSTQNGYVYQVLSWVDENSNDVNVGAVTPENVSSLKAVAVKIPVKISQLVGELVPANDPLLPKNQKYVNGMYIQGAQIRIPSEDGKKTWGLRFINVINNELVVSLLQNGEVSNVAYGTLLVPEGKYTEGDEVTFEYPNVTNVPGDNIFLSAGKFQNRYFKYTACIVNIPQKQFKTKLIVRPYLTFEYEGNKIVLYGEQYDSASLFTVAQVAVGENSIEDDVTKEWINKNIIDVLKRGDNDTEVEF